MKKINVLIALSFLLAGTSFGLCNFGTMQPVLAYSTTLGSTVTSKIYLYNLYGDRITHVVVKSFNAPEGWNVTFEPAKDDYLYSIPGGTTSILENLGVEPMGRTNNTEEIEGVEYIVDPVNVGYYIPAKPLVLRIQVPRDADLWKTYDVLFTLTGWCTADSPGSVAVTQERDFSIRIRTVALEYFEQRVVNFWEVVKQYSLYIAIVCALIVTIVVVLILKKMGKLIIKVELK